MSNSNDSTVTLIVKGKRIRAFREFYDQGLKGKGLFAIWGSTGFLEISIAGRSAAKLLKASREDEVTIEFS